MAARGKRPTAWICAGCSSPATRWRAQCAVCHGWNLLIAAQQAAALGLALPVTMIPEPKVKRWPTGIESVDRALGGGVAQGLSMVISGLPGCGKSTLLAQWLGAVARRHAAVYITIEESVDMLRSRVGRLGLADRDRLLLVQKRTLPEVQAMIERTNAAAVVVDSADKLARRSGVRAEAIVDQLTQLAHECSAAVWIPAHVNKQLDRSPREKIAGSMSEQHDGDVVAWLDGDPAVSTDRELILLKNRGGPSHLRAPLVMTESGLVAAATNVIPIRPGMSP